MKKQADGRYKTSILVGYDANGKPIRKHVTAKTKKEFEQKKEEIKRLYITGNTEPVRRDILFGTYSWEWYEVYKATTLKAAGKSYYKTALNHIVPVFGERQIRSITPTDLQRYLNRQAEEYSKSSVERDYLTLKQIFKLATAQYIIGRDPMLTVVCPNAPEGERRALTEAETAAALHVARTHEHGLLWALLYYTGARLGEVLGLQWNDINFKTHELTIRRDIDYKVTGGASQEGDVKSYDSERTIPIADELYEILLANRRLSTYVIKAPKSNDHLPQATAKRHIDALRRAMYEFDSTIEHKDSPEYTTRKNNRDKKNAAQGKKPRNFKTERIPPQVSVITSHYFRHNFATLCYYSGVDVLTAAAWMGHKDPTMIMKIYAHLDKTKARDPEKLNNIFSFTIGQKVQII